MSVPFSPEPAGRLDPPEVVVDAIPDAAPVAAPKLAVVISCYNYERYVRAAIDSVRAQGRDDCELIVVDDGSTDGSWEAIRATGVPAISIRNIGGRRACIAGLNRTRAPFVLFLDADDLLAPGALDRILPLLDPGVAKLQFPLTRIDAEGQVLGPGLPALETFRGREAIAGDVLRTGCYVSPPTSGNVFRRDLCGLLAEAEYDKHLDGVILFAAPFYGDVVSVSEELGRYRVHGRNISGQGQKPNVAAIRYDLDRFVNRMAHLRAVIAARAPGQTMVATEASYYYLERRICADLAAGRRPGLRDLVATFGAMRRERWSAKKICGLSAFFLGAAVLPVARAQNLMAYRFRFGPRSARGFLQAVMRGT